MHQFLGHVVRPHANDALACGQVLLQLFVRIGSDVLERRDHRFDRGHVLRPLACGFHDFDEALDARLVLRLAEVARVGLIAVERYHGNAKVG